MAPDILGVLLLIIGGGLPVTMLLYGLTAEALPEHPEQPERTWWFDRVLEWLFVR